MPATIHETVLESERCTSEEESDWDPYDPEGTFGE